jgi:hypothetical protein
MIKHSRMVTESRGVLLASIVLASLSTPGLAQMPTAEQLARAEKYEPPKLRELASKLKGRPDMTGTWVLVEPAGACPGPLFDPANATCPSNSEGGSEAGPAPGTKLTAIPYNRTYAAMYEQHIAEALAGKKRDTFPSCVPYGVPRAVGASAAPFDIVQAPEVMFWFHPEVRTTRKILMDGSKHPVLEAGDFFSPGLGPTYSGHSIAHWEGDTLVIHTQDMMNAYFDGTAAPHSEKLEMVERLKLIDANLLENEMTLTDPKAFTKPWVVKRLYRRIAPQGAAQAEGGIPRAYVRMNDRACRPQVDIDRDGFQVPFAPQQ